jgi:hypothetical protein
VEIDGAAATAEGRTDVLVQLHGKPLAVFELKRPGSPLTREDEAQGLSYAKVMDPRYPLVVITNGDETRLLATHTSEPWRIEVPSEEAFAKLVDAAGRVATASIKEAVSTLMGSSPTVWMNAVRVASAVHIGEMQETGTSPGGPSCAASSFRGRRLWRRWACSGMDDDSFSSEAHRSSARAASSAN